MNGWNRSSATAMSCPTSSGVGIDMATSARWPRGSRTPSVGSVPITRSFTAARNTDLTLRYRVWMVPGASPAAFARGQAGGGPVDRSDLYELDARLASRWG